VEITGDIGTTTGKIIFSGNAVIRYFTVLEDRYLKGSMNLLARGMDGALDKDYDPEAYDARADFGSNEPASISGTVFFKNVCYSSNNSHVDLTTSDMVFTVPSGSALYILEEVIFLDVEVRVAGDLTVTNTGYLVMTDRDTTLSVTGTFTAERCDSKAARVQVINMIVGGTAADFNKIFLPNLMGTATVTGAGSFENLNRMDLIVFSGATVSADVLVEWMADTRNTEFYVEDTLLYTVYVGPDEGRNLAIAITKTIGSGPEQKTVTDYNLVPALQDMKFIAWQTYDEKTKTYKAIEGTKGGNYGMETWVGQAGYTKVYADITKDIYRIYVLAAEGIDDVYIDGKIIAHDGTYFYAEIAAGSHTIEYTKANGYSGDAYISVIDGEKTSGTSLAFTVNDDNYKADGSPYSGDGKVISLTGIVKSGIDKDPDTHTEQSSGLTVTEILLIIVVVIMAIMAVVLILRLNRS